LTLGVKGCFAVSNNEVLLNNNYNVENYENEVNTVLDHMMAGFQLGIISEDKNSD